MTDSEVWKALLTSVVGAAVFAAAAIWGTFAMIHADEAKERKQSLEGASTDELKRLERELSDVQRELKKRRTPHG